MLGWLKKQLRGGGSPKSGGSVQENAHTTTEITSQRGGVSEKPAENGQKSIRIRQSGGHKGKSTRVYLHPETLQLLKSAAQDEKQEVSGPVRNLIDPIVAKLRLASSHSIGIIGMSGLWGQIPEKTDDPQLVTYKIWLSETTIDVLQKRITQRYVSAKLDKKESISKMLSRCIPLLARGGVVRIVAKDEADEIPYGSIFEEF